jgi:hypothetical protein
MAGVIGVYWEGQIPRDPLHIQILDENNTPVSLASYNSFKVRMLDSDNREVDLEDSFLDSSDVNNGRFTFNFPKDRSLFPKYGDYVAQLEFIGVDGSTDFTSSFTMRVKKLGRR